MGFYSKHILPRLIQSSMAHEELLPFRRRVISRASGRVLEVGIGAGVNLALYGPNVREVVGLEPSPQLMLTAQRAAEHATRPINLISGWAEHLPLDSQSVDTVVTTWTMCSIVDAPRALREMRRVLKPDGQLLFVEHGLAPEAGMRRWQNLLTPLWKRLGGGCHLNRPIEHLIERSGFAIEQLQTGYLRARLPMTFMYEGRARPAAR